MLAQQSESGPSAGDLQEIVVTATKRSENLQAAPVAVSAISSSALQAIGVVEISDLNGSIPNLQVSSPYGSQQPHFSLRGVGVGTEYNANAASPVGVYVDESTRLFGPATASNSTISIRSKPSAALRERCMVGSVLGR